MLRTGKELLAAADEEGFAVGAFNISNLEVLIAVVSAAEALNSPAIIAISEGAIAYAGFENILALARTAAAESKCEFAVHLDHGRDRELVSRCIRSGFTSVMYDGSSLPFEENVARTRDVVEEAGEFGVSVEGELGRLVGIEEDVDVSERDAFFTDPSQALEFVEKTGVDSLAVSVGTSHGPYKFKGETKLDFERLKEIDRLVDIPLVLHGASGVSKAAVARARAAGVDIEGAKGVSDDAIREAVRCGIRKINIDTDMRLVFATALRETLATDPKLFDPRKILSPVREAVCETVKAKMKLFGSARSGFSH